MSLAEMDMDDMFKQIPQDEVIESVDWIFSVLNGSFRSHRKKTNLKCKETWFSISKAGDRGLDRVGKSSARTFHVVHEDMVKRFLKFNLRGNTLLLLGMMILRQGACGVPIGEFLSAQLAEIWCAWHEYRSLFAPLDPSTPVSPFEREVQQALSCSYTWCDSTDLSADLSANHVPGAQCPVCGAMYNSFSLARDVDYTVAPHCARSIGVSGSILISPMVHTLTDEQVCDTGFTGMWAPVDQPFGFLGLGDTQVILACRSQWDGAAEGRLHKVIANTPRRNRAYARDFLQKLDPLQAVMGEVVALEPWTPSVSTCLSRGDRSGGGDDTPTPIVLFSRYGDNVYIAFINVPPCMDS